MTLVVWVMVVILLIVLLVKKMWVMVKVTVIDGHAKKNTVCTQTQMETHQPAEIGFVLITPTHRKSIDGVR